MATFNTLPFELHSHIAYLSCLSDVGQSVLSLSRVSRYLNQVSTPYLFHTVSVTGLPRISLLDSALQKCASSVEPSAGILLRNLHLEMKQPVSPSERGTLVAAISRILSLSSGTLRTLTIDFSGAMQDSPIVFARLFRTSLPKLEDLNLVGFYPNPTIPSPPSSRRPSAPPSPTDLENGRIEPSLAATHVEKTTNFPIVQRLHLNGNRNPTGLLSVGSLASVFPALEELKVSGLSMAVGFATDVRDSLSHSSPQPVPSPISGEESGLASDDILSRSGIQSTPFMPIETSPVSRPLTIFDFAPRLPAKLRVLRVQPAPAIEPSTGPMPNTTAVTKDEGMMSLFRGIEDSYAVGARELGTAPYDGVRFELLERGVVEREQVFDSWKSNLCG